MYVCMYVWYITVGDDECEVHEGNAADDLLVAEVLSRGVLVGGDSRCITAHLRRLVRRGRCGRDSIGMGHIHHVAPSRLRIHIIEEVV